MKKSLFKVESLFVLWGKMIEDRKNNSYLSVTRPINIKVDTDINYRTFTKDDKPICKLNIEDSEVMYDAIRLLSGVIGNNLNIAEIEQLRDLITETVGS